MLGGVEWAALRFSLFTLENIAPGDHTG